MAKPGVTSHIQEDIFEIQPINTSLILYERFISYFTENVLFFH